MKWLIENVSDMFSLMDAKRAGVSCRFDQEEAVEGLLNY